MDSPIIVISDFLIQSPEVLLNFKNILEKAEEIQPIAFILIGEFFKINDIKLKLYLYYLKNGPTIQVTTEHL